MSPRAKRAAAVALAAAAGGALALIATAMVASGRAHAAPPDMAAPFDIEAVVRERCERGIEQLRRGLAFPKTMTVRQCRLSGGAIRIAIEAQDIYEQMGEGWFLVDVPGEPDVIVYGDRTSAAMLRPDMARARRKRE